MDITSLYIIIPNGEGLLVLKHNRAQQLDRQSAVQVSQKENNDSIQFTLAFHPHNHAVKSNILKDI